MRRFRKPFLIDCLGKWVKVELVVLSPLCQVMKRNHKEIFRNSTKISLITQQIVPEHHSSPLKGIRVVDVDVDVDVFFTACNFEDLYVTHRIQITFVLLLLHSLLNPGVYWITHRCR